MSAELDNKTPNDINDDIKNSISPDFISHNKDNVSEDSRPSLGILKNNENNPSGATDLNSPISDLESKVSNGLQSPWATTVRPQRKVANGKNGFGKPRFNQLRKKGPIGFIIAALLAGGAMGFAGSASLPMAILGNGLQKANIQETSATRRANLLLAKKLAYGDTYGTCAVATTLCKINRPSNRLITQLEKNGVQAINKDGEVIKKRSGLLLDEKPKKYRFTRSNGKTIEVSAKQKDIYKVLLDDSEFRAAMHKASYTRFATLADSVFTKIKTRFGTNLIDKFRSVKNDKEVSDVIDENVKVEDTGAEAAIKEAAESGSDAAEREAIEDIITKESDESLEKLGKSGKGNMVGLVAGGVCLVADVPGMITRANRSFQMRQVIKYAMLFLTAASAIKAGDATSTEVAAIGKLLTEKSSSGKSAMNSFGMDYIFSKKATPTNTNYRKLIPGGSVAAVLGTTSVLMRSKIKTNACGIATSPTTGLAIDVAIGGATLGVGTIVNFIGGVVLGFGISKILPVILNEVISLIPTESILKLFFGDFTKDLKYESAGDGIVSGFLHVVGQTGNAGANMPLTVPQAVAYAKETEKVQLAYAAEDQATLSPFDTSSPYTMMGSFVQKLSSLYTSSSSESTSFAGILSTTLNLVTKSPQIALESQTASAESSDGSEYQTCEDGTIDSSIAAGPYCNIIYGIPTQYLDLDPVDVANDLIASGDIDPTTGDPIDKGDDTVDLITGNLVGVTSESLGERTGGLKDWIDLCTDGKTDQAKNCMITDKTTAEYALYMIDRRVQRAMDGEDADLEAAINSGTVAFYSPAATNNVANKSASKSVAKKSSSTKTVTQCQSEILDKFFIRTSTACSFSYLSPISQKVLSR